MIVEKIDLEEGEQVQWVGVYILKWRPEWGQPTVGFREKGACVWVYDSAYDVWKTTCEETFVFTDGAAPADSGMRFCPYCGGRLIEEGNDD